MPYQKIEKDKWQENLKRALLMCQQLEEDLKFVSLNEIEAQLLKIRSEYKRMTRLYWATETRHKHLAERFNKAVVDVKRLVMQLKYGKVLLAQPEDLQAYEKVLKRVQVKARVQRHRAKRRAAKIGERWGSTLPLTGDSDGEVQSLPASPTQAG